jgi:ElaB/YqjD/DUF883 family membrane-anchored ribosome-binding protein
MPDQSEVIMGQMEETRKDLGEKLQTLEKKVAGTVETVTGTIQTVEHTVENVKDTIKETVEAVTDKVHDTVQAVEETVESTVESVKSFFDVSYQVDRHPWLIMSGSVLLGYLGGCLLTPRRRHKEAPALPAVETYTPPPPRPAAPQPPAAESAAREPERTEEGGESLLGKLTTRFAPEVNKLKGLAVGTLFGVARDMISRWLPDPLKEQVTDVINNFTTDLGGQVIREPLVAPSQQEDEKR